MECECGFAFESVGPGELGERMREVTSSYESRLMHGPESDLAFHSTAGVWSALEYGCHVRDVLFNIRDRILLALVENCPRFAPLHREERIGLARYADESPASVADGIRLGGNLLALLIEGLSPAQMRRVGLYAGVERDVLWIGRQALHEASHHVGDIDRSIASARRDR